MTAEHPPFRLQTAAQRHEAEERQLAALRVFYPGQTFHEVFGGWIALPDGVPLIMAIDLDGIAAKLKQHYEERQGETES